MTRMENEYAQALFSLAQDEGLSDRILGEMEIIGQTLDEQPGLLRILSAPNISKEERCGIVDKCYGQGAHPYVLNFMKLMTEKGYARHLPACCKAYRALYNEANGILAVSAVTAVPLTDAQSERLRLKLEGMTGKKIQLTNRVDAGVMGGVRLDYDGKRVDDTIRHRLEAVRGLLIGSAV